MREETANKIMEAVRSGYDTIAGEFAASRGDLWWPELEDFRKLVKSGDRVLDIGCGSGRAFKVFAGAAIEYEGLDVSAKLIAIAKREHADLLADFRVGSMLALPYEDASFDAVLMIAALHHVPSERFRLQALREAARVLRPGGRLMMTNWDLWGHPKRWRWLGRNLWLKLLRRSDLDWNDLQVPWKRGVPETVWRYYHLFTLAELRRLCRAAGLEVEENVRTSARRRDGAVNLKTVCRKPSG